MSYPRLMYDYSYGEEDVPSVEIQVINIEDQMYSVKLSQAGDKHFYDIKVREGHEQISRKVELSEEIPSESTESPLNEVVITLLVRAKCNPPPERETNKEILFPEKIFKLTSLVKMFK